MNKPRPYSDLIASLGNLGAGELEEMPPVEQLPEQLPIEQSMMQAPIEGPKTISDILARRRPVSQPEIDMVPKQPEEDQFAKRLAEAQEAKARQDALINTLDASKGFLQSGMMWGGVSPQEAQQVVNSDMYDKLRKQSGSKLERLQTETKLLQEQDAVKERKALSDPASDISKQYRQMAKEIGVPVPENIPANVIKDKIDLVFKGREAELNRRLKEAEIAIRREDLESKKLERLQKADTKESLEAAKEERKEQREIAKEDRKIRRDLDNAENTLTTQLKDLKTIKSDFEKYSKGSLFGTGRLATLGGTTKMFSEKTEQLDSKFKKIALDEMVKMFAGMSKAVDSDAERRAFEATQPSIELHDTTNRRLLDDKIKAAESLLKKTKEAKQKYDQFGTFDPAVTREAAQTTEKVVVQNSKGQRFRLPKSQLQSAIAQGYTQVEE